MNIISLVLHCFMNSKYKSVIRGLRIKESTRSVQYFFHFVIGILKYLFRIIYILQTSFKQKNMNSQTVDRTTLTLIN